MWDRKSRDLQLLVKHISIHVFCEAVQKWCITLEESSRAKLDENARAYN